MFVFVFCDDSAKLLESTLIKQKKRILRIFGEQFNSYRKRRTAMAEAYGIGREIARRVY